MGDLHTRVFRIRKFAAEESYLAAEVNPEDVRQFSKRTVVGIRRKPLNEAIIRLKHRLFSCSHRYPRPIGQDTEARTLIQMRSGIYSSGVSLPRLIWRLFALLILLAVVLAPLQVQADPVVNEQCWVKKLSGVYRVGATVKIFVQENYKRPTG